MKEEWNKRYLWRQIGNDRGDDETGNGSDRVGNALQNAGKLRCQVDIAQQEAAHDGDFTAGLINGQKKNGHVAIFKRQLADH